MPTWLQTLALTGLLAGFGSSTAGTATGTGFFVSSDGLAATNFHVVEGARHVRVMISGSGVPLDATIVRVDRANDLAILKVNGNFRALSLASSSKVRRGERVYAMGFPQISIQGLEPKLTDGIVSSLTGIGDEPRTFQVSNPIQPGNSGGPLFQADGRVVGVIVATLNARRFLSQGTLPQNVNYAIKSNYLLELLRTIRPDFAEAPIPPNSRQELVDVVASVEKSTLLVIASSEEASAAIPATPHDYSPRPPQGPPDLLARGCETLVKIGHVAPTTGPIGHLGKDNEYGARMAVDDLNRIGVMLCGKRVTFELSLFDDAGDPRRGVEVAKELVARRVSGVVGHLNSGTSILASKIYSDSGIPQISPSATNPKLTRQGFRTVFRLIADDAYLGSVLGRYAVSELKGKSIVTIDDRTAYGQGIAEAFAKGVTSSRGSIQDAQYTSDKATNFTAVLLSIKNSNPDVIFFGGMDSVAGPLLRQMRQLGLTAKLLGGDGICTMDLPKLSEGALADGQVVCAEAGGILGTQRPGMDKFREDFRGKFNTEVQIYAPYVYDAVNIMVAAMVKANSSDPASYLPFLAKTQGYRGVTGIISFDDKGDLLNGALTLYTYRGYKREQMAVVR